MANAKSARVVATQSLSEDTRLLDLAADEPLGFVGGQYVIVDSGLVLENGKAVKRAYSVLTGDAEQARFQIAVKRVGSGLASGFLHRIEVGECLRFSGPWGKLSPRAGALGPSLVLATDTGITAALGLLQSARFAPLLTRAVLIWLSESPDYFLPERVVRSRIPAGCADVSFGALPPIAHPERIPYARRVLAGVLARTQLEQAFICGDGAVNYALLDDLVAAGIAATRDNVESFFNMPKKSA
jgi:ferredoxin-NADP reductase